MGTIECFNHNIFGNKSTSFVLPWNVYMFSHCELAWIYYFQKILPKILLKATIRENKMKYCVIYNVCTCTRGKIAVTGTFIDLVFVLMSQGKTWTEYPSDFGLVCKGMAFGRHYNTHTQLYLSAKLQV